MRSPPNVTPEAGRSQIGAPDIRSFTNVLSVALVRLRFFGRKASLRPE